MPPKYLHVFEQTGIISYNSVVAIVKIQSKFIDMGPLGTQNLVSFHALLILLFSEQMKIGPMDKQDFSKKKSNICIIRAQLSCKSVTHSLCCCHGPLWK